MLVACVEVPSNCAQPADGVALVVVIRYSPDVVSSGNLTVVAVLVASTVIVEVRPEVPPTKSKAPVVPLPTPALSEPVDAIVSIQVTVALVVIP